jgi:hypothetical protein
LLIGGRRGGLVVVEALHIFVVDPIGDRFANV